MKHLSNRIAPIMEAKSHVIPAKAGAYPRVTVGTSNLHDFFMHPRSVGIPDYQRPYIWDLEKVEELILDLEEHFVEELGEDPKPYYMGTILLHERGNQLEVVDGQQRITTLLILNYHWHSSHRYLDASRWQLTYNSFISQQNIQKVGSMLRDRVSSLRNKIEDVFRQIVCTFVTTSSEDEAFTFFDSQNTRGVPLSTIDFLKSYHLRAMKELPLHQQELAKSWDLQNTNQFLRWFFNEILWRSRNWRGNQVEFETRKTLLKAFQKNTINRKPPHIIQLYPVRFNQLASKMIFSPEAGAKPIEHLNEAYPEPREYPFSIRQPIDAGNGFFLFTQKYHAIYKYLFSPPIPQLEIYKTLISANSWYFKQFFELCIVFYHDQFGEDKIHEMALWMDYLLGSYRINQKSIVSRTVIKILRDKSRNLLDVIDAAYLPSEVFEFMNKSVFHGWYDTDLSKDSKNGVRKSYRKAVLEFYQDVRNGSTDLKNKKQWMHNKIAPNNNDE
jgi:hypothetical protein